jgi:16S rRNA (uracil1498-N3)-methyltransferase
VQIPRNLSDVLAEPQNAVLLDPSGRSLASILSARENVEQSSWLLLVGPEGGFTPEEVEAARAAGADIVSLGPFTLRTETAALGAISRLMLWAELVAGDGGGFRIR